MKTAILTIAAGSALAMHCVAVTAQPGPSLQERRLEVIKGTSPGIVLIGGRRDSKAPATAASSAPAASTAGPAAAKPVGAGTGGGTVSPAPAARVAVPLPWAEPPSGKPLNDARRLDSPTQGIALPVAGGAASQAAAKEPSKPGR